MRRLFLIICCLCLIELPLARSQEVRSAVFDTSLVAERIAAAKQLSSSQADSAILLLENTLTTSAEIHYLRGVIQSIQQLGRLYTDLGRYEECKERFLQQLAICGRPGPLISAVPVLLNGLGNLYKLEGNYEEAAKSYYRAIDVARQLQVHSSGSVYNNLAAVLHFLQQSNEALQALDQAEALAKLSGDYDLIASIHTNRGLVYKDRNMPDSSMHFFHKALELAREHNNETTVFTTLTNMAQTSLKKGAAQQALQYLLEGQQINASINPFYKLVALETIALSYEHLEQPDKALEFYHSGLETARMLNLNENVMSISEKLATLYFDRKEPSKAYALLKESLQLRDSFQNRQAMARISQLGFRYRMAEQEKELMHQQLLISEQQAFLKKKNLWLALSTGGALILGLLLILSYTWYRNKRRLQQKQIQLLEQEQTLMRRSQEIEKLKATMRGEERERQRLAQELHDGIGGMLTAIHMNLKALQAKGKDDPELNAITKMVSETSQEVRETAHNLMPGLLINHHLGEALHLYFDHLHSPGLSIHLQIHGPAEQVDHHLSLTVFRIIQELLQNIIKHSEASVAEVQLRIVEDRLILNVEDNGRGFDRKEIQTGIGLENVTSRIQAAGGYCSIESSPGMGTTIHIELSLKENTGILYEDTFSHS